MARTSTVGAVRGWGELGGIQHQYPKKHGAGGSVITPQQAERPLLIIAKDLAEGPSRQDAW